MDDCNRLENHEETSALDVTVAQFRNRAPAVLTKQEDETLPSKSPVDKSLYTNEDNDHTVYTGA